MADITMCATKDCPNEMYCLRKLARPKEHGQSWANFEWKLDATEDKQITVNCKDYIYAKIA